jgi:aspartate kinase
VGAAVPGEQAAAAVAALAGSGPAAVTLDEGVGRVTVVGAELSSWRNAAAEFAGLLERSGIPVLLRAAAERRVSCVVPAPRLDEAVRRLHGALFEGAS